MSRYEASRQAVDSRTSRSRLGAFTWKHQVGWMTVAGMVLALLLQFRGMEGDRTAEAKPPRRALQSKSSQSKSSQAKSPQAKVVQGRAKLPRAEHPQHDVMALVNGKDISRKDLINACVSRFGEGVLESLVNKRLILSHCENRGISITQRDIDVEVNRMAKRFKLGREQWFDMLKKERDITPEEYERDIVWPTLALRKLAAKQVMPSREELDKTFVRDYGEMVGARLIALNDADLARRIQAELTANPDSFARMAIEHSIDVNSASVGGLIQPIRHYVGSPAIEQAAFQLQPGGISPVIPVVGQFVILKCEKRIPPRRVDRAEIEAQLIEKIKDEKLRGVANTLFADLQRTATTVNVYNNPKLRETMPGVVATINGDRITMQELGQECFLRHGNEVLETEISHLLLEQSLQRARLEVSEADLQAEVAHAAVLAGVMDEQGNADLTAWFASVLEQQGGSQKQYLRDSVWPSAALKKLTAKNVNVTEEDLQKGFEANYGQRVRCLAIVLPSMRRAQEVWEKARRNPTPQFFGDLAAEYSVEPTSKALRGEVPPLQRFGGQPQLEKAAFALQQGELSGIIQVGDKFIILRAEGRTETMDINLATVRKTLHRDIYEKKLRIAMSKKFEGIRYNSRVDNYLAGTSHAPPEQAKVRKDSALRQTAVQR